MILLPFHPAVLEPDLDLPLRQAKRVGDLHPAPARQVPVVVELLLELQDLLARVGRPRALRLTACEVRVYCGTTIEIRPSHHELLLEKRNNYNPLPKYRRRS